MLWRVRATLPDRPGTLAVLAASCGAAEVNILGFQIFPGVGAVTDELVLGTPGGWGPREVRHLVETSGGSHVEVTGCSEATLVDQPTRYVQAARAILEHPTSYPEVVGRLFDVDTVLAPGPDAPEREADVMQVTVGDMVMQVRRDLPFTVTEHARGAALADLVSDVVRRADDGVPGGRQETARRLGEGAVPDYVVDGTVVSAVVEDAVVGRAVVLPGDDATSRCVTLRVDPAWQRRGIGTRLLVHTCRLARALGGTEIVLTTRSGNQAVLPMVLAAGLRGRIRLSGEELTVRVSVVALRALSG